MEPTPTNGSGSHFSGAHARTDEDTDEPVVGAHARADEAIEDETLASHAAPSAGSHAAGAHAAGKTGAHAAVSVEPTRKPKTWLIVALIALVVVAGGGIAFGVSRCSQAPTAASGTIVKVTIDEGSPTVTIADKLVEAGVIGNSRQFVRRVEERDVSASLKPGKYEFTGGSDMDTVIDLLVAGPNATEGMLTVAEGLTLAETAKSVEDQLGIPASTFEGAAKAKNYVGIHPFLADVGDGTLEGYLFPKTYDFRTTEATTDAVIRAMLDQFESETAGIDFEAGRAAINASYGLNLSNYDVVKLASVVECEALTNEQRPKVASVFLNRLKAGMKLESDATIAYVTGGTDARSDRNVESPYNSYMNAGLPPTAVCSPSAESIKAVLAPASTDYLYFWITNSAEKFSTTYEEHQSTYDAAVSG